MRKQVKHSESNNMELFMQLEETIEDFELKTQKALSLIALGVDAKESFNETMLSLNKMESLHELISDETVKFISAEKINITIDTFRAKLMQAKYTHIHVW